MITYCTNIHPGESWGETFKNLESFLPAVKAAVSPHEPFPVGLRLSKLAACEVDEYKAAEFAGWLEEAGLYLPTVNGFPYGEFHSGSVKENVYLPDWRSSARVDYTLRIASLLDFWLPENVRGSISTVPVAFREGFDRVDLATVRKHLYDVLQGLDRLRQKSGKEIVLSLEPEPGCHLETTGEVVSFFEEMNFPEDLRSGIGVCFDCCHQAIQFESPAKSLALLEDAGIKIGKVQISSAPSIINPSSPDLELFQEQVYLHQVVVRNVTGNQLSRYNDLPDALGRHVPVGDEEWRIHFHMPVFLEQAGRISTTRAFIEEMLPLLDDDMLLEVETYTLGVLPQELMMSGVTDSIIRELKWVRALKDETNRRS